MTKKSAWNKIYWKNYDGITVYYFHFFFFYTSTYPSTCHMQTLYQKRSSLPNQHISEASKRKAVLCLWSLVSHREAGHSPPAVPYMLGSNPSIRLHTVSHVCEWLDVFTKEDACPHISMQTKMPNLLSHFVISFELLFFQLFSVFVSNIWGLGYIMIS